MPCTVMSMMSNELMSSACEVDICGVIGMHALRLASGTPSALLDWNNNYGDDPDKAVCFHCSNLPKHFFVDVRMDYQAIIAGTVGRDNTYGTCVGRVKAGPMTLRPLLDRRRARARSAATSARASSPTTRSRRSAAPASCDIPRDAGAAPLHLRERLRAPRRRQPVVGGRHRPRGGDELPGVGRVLAQVGHSRVSASESDRTGEADHWRTGERRERLWPLSPASISEP